MSDDKSLGSSDEIPSSLPPVKLQALRLLRANKSISRTARDVGLHRSTVCRWIKEDPNFAAEYQAWKDSKKVAVEAVIYAASPAAARCLARQARKDSSAAAKLLKLAAAYANQKQELTDPDEVQQENLVVTEQRKVQREARKEELLEAHLKVAARRSQREAAIELHEQKLSGNAPTPDEPDEEDDDDFGAFKIRDFDTDEDDDDEDGDDEETDDAVAAGPGSKVPVDAAPSPAGVAPAANASPSNSTHAGRPEIKASADSAVETDPQNDRFVKAMDEFIKKYG